MLVFFLVYKLVYKTKVMRCKDMDLHTGMRELNLAALVAEEEFERAAWPSWKRAYKFLC